MGGILAVLLLSLASPALAAPPSQATYDAVVDQVLAEPYQPAYVPAGFDTAFPGMVANTLPAQDYTTGSVPGNPDHPEWPAEFQQIVISSADGAPLTARLALQPGTRPGVVVVHGFNTNGKESVIRWAAMLAKNGYNVLAADQRDFRAEFQAGYGYPNWLQTFGWKETEDVVAAGRYLDAQPGVSSVGVIGFSLGGQDTVLALEVDADSGDPVFDAALNFSGPADQNTQVYSGAVPPGCQTPACTYPATGALIALVVPPSTYTDPCRVLRDASGYYGPDPYTILSKESAYRAQLRALVPLLNLYSEDDSLVKPYNATMMAGYNTGAPLQRTVLVRQGEHAYFYDRWWQQRATLLYFKGLLPGAAADALIGTVATVNQTPGGASFSSQLVPLGSPDRTDADAFLGPYICDTSRPPPATAVLCAGRHATVVGDDGPNELNGTPGADVIVGGPGDDTIDGGGGNDHVCGGAGTDMVRGGAGSDLVDPGAGDDRAEGGDGSDALVYTDAPSGVTANLATGAASGGGGTDSFEGFESVLGSTFADNLTGDAARNNLLAQGGNDTLHGEDGADGLDPGGGTDVVNGGGGFDNASYFFRTLAVTLTLDGQANDGSSLEGDNIGPSGDIEALQAGPANDSLTGNGADNNLFGQGGNDTLNGEGGNDGIDPGPGQDTLNGGQGFDIASYFFRAAGVTLSLDNSANDGEPQEGDNIGPGGDVEGLQGGRGNDTLTGNNAPNRFNGQAGDDSITSRDGPPAQADTVLCGPGADSVIADASDVFPEVPSACETVTLG